MKKKSVIAEGEQRKEIEEQSWLCRAFDYYLHYSTTLTMRPSVEWLSILSTEVEIDYIVLVISSTVSQNVIISHTRHTWLLEDRRTADFLPRCFVIN